jgi:lipid II:glycine glycyltransferase (peptidoglycan interpeptide bridge formation enzyme)
MNIRLIPDDFGAEEYNKYVYHPLQTWQWGEARKQMGTDIMRFGVYDNEQLNHCFLMTIHPIPYTHWKVGYIPKSVIPSLEVVQEFIKIAASNKIIFIKWEPNAIQNDQNAEQIKILQQRVSFVESSHPLFPKWTMTLDLTPPEDQLMAGFKEKTRYNIRLAGRKGVSVNVEDTVEGFETFSTLYFDTTKRQHYYGHNKEYHKIVWNTMKNGLAHILISRFENEPLGAYELFYFKNTLYYPYGGSSDLHRNVMAPNLLMWEAIRLGKQLGATSFDMWGSTTPSYDEKDPFYGFTRFKEGYNAKFVEMIGSFDLIINSSLYKAYSAVHYLRKLYLSIRA